MSRVEDVFVSTVDSPAGVAKCIFAIDTLNPDHDAACLTDQRKPSVAI
ncbi:MAG: hypothetical protein AAGL89_13335 [Pseudomonadota bacterium]